MNKAYLLAISWAISSFAFTNSNSSLKQQESWHCRGWGDASTGTRVQHQYPHKKPGMVACAFNSCASKVETSGSLEFASQPANSSKQAKDPSKRVCLKENKRVASEEQYLRLTSDLHTYMNKHTCTTHTHIELLKYRPHALIPSKKDNR